LAQPWPSLFGLNDNGGGDVNLWDTSIDVIKQNQAPNGAFVASPNFPTYHYSWFRDGAYIAYALDLAGEHDAAGRFFDWALWVIGTRTEQAHRAIATGRSGRAPSGADLLETRYAVDGRSGEADWPNNQLDGFGTLLWAIEQHVRLAGAVLSTEQLASVALLADYLSALWRFPCSDCWEEFHDKIHIATLAAIYGGLQSAAWLTGQPEFAAEAVELRQFVLEQGVIDGHLAKFIGSPWVDASLIHVATPHRLLEPDDPIMQATIAKIETDLRTHGGGVHRYVDDNYYGGGEWVLLTAYLGWYYAETGESQRASELLAWIEARSDRNGHLFEQAPENLIYPDMLAVWERQWGTVATPLVWSHAAYITLANAIGERSTSLPSAANVSR
jgi:GH15 family glucan-1,4-alpha-glucosidase